MSEDSDGRKERMAQTVRLVVTRRERAPRSPRMERALKRLLWRYTGAAAVPGGAPPKEAKTRGSDPDVEGER